MCVIIFVLMARLTLYVQVTGYVFFECSNVYMFSCNYIGQWCPFVINSETRHFRGTVTVVSADNPASASLGGFKQSASAFRFCRHCMGSERVFKQRWILYLYLIYILCPLLQN